MNDDTQPKPIDWDQVIGELSKPDGWLKGDYGSYHEPVGPVCLRGAIFRVLGYYDIWQAKAALDEIVITQYPDRVSGDTFDDPVPVFNDHRDTTLDDVILVCEKARAASGEIR